MNVVRFGEIQRRFDESSRASQKVDGRLGRLESRMDSNGRTMIFMAVSMSASMIGGFGALVAVVATKL
jgi:hypothetical protein